jgi:hypothetical protein
MVRDPAEFMINYFFSNYLRPTQIILQVFPEHPAHTSGVYGFYEL